MAKKAFNARLDEGLLGRLDEEVQRRGVSKTQALEEAIEQWLSPVVAADAQPRDVPNRVQAAVDRINASSRRPLVRSGADLMMERQRRLNKQMGWGQGERS